MSGNGCDVAVDARQKLKDHVMLRRQCDYIPSESYANTGDLPMGMDISVDAEVVAPS